MRNSTMVGSALLGLLASIAAIVVPCGARADAVPRPDLTRAIAREVDVEAHREQVWWTTWTLVYAGLTVGQGIAAGVSSDRGTQADLGVGAATSVLGVIGMFLSPTREVEHTARALDRLASDAEADPAGRDESAVRLRARAADAERDGRSWAAHALNVAVSGASSLVLWQGFDRGTSALTNFGSGLAVGELQLWTQPAGLLRDTPAVQAASRPSSALTTTVGWSGRALFVRLTF